MTYLRLFVAFLLAAWLAMPVVADAQGKNDVETVLTTTEVSTAGGAETVAITNPNHGAAYLIVKTENEVATATLDVTVKVESSLGDQTVFTNTTDISTNTTTIYLVGSSGGAEGVVAQAGDMPLPRDFNVIFTVAGAGADFDVSAELHYVTPAN